MNKFESQTFAEVDTTRNTKMKATHAMPDRIPTFLSIFSNREVCGIVNQGKALCGCGVPGVLILE